MESTTDRFFRLDKKELIKIFGVGIILGLAITLVSRFVLKMTDPLASFRAATIIMTVITIFGLTFLKIEMAPLISVATLIVLWGRYLNGMDLFVALVFYGVLTGVLMLGFGWVSQIQDWRLRILATIIAILFLSMF